MEPSHLDNMEVDKIFTPPKNRHQPEASEVSPKRRSPARASEVSPKRTSRNTSPARSHRARASTRSKRQEKRPLSPKKKSTWSENEPDSDIIQPSTFQQQAAQFVQNPPSTQFIPPPSETTYFSEQSIQKSPTKSTCRNQTLRILIREFSKIFRAVLTNEEISILSLLEQDTQNYARGDKITNLVKTFSEANILLKDRLATTPLDAFKETPRKQISKRNFGKYAEYLVACYLPRVGKTASLREIERERYERRLEMATRVYADRMNLFEDD